MWERSHYLLNEGEKGNNIIKHLSLTLIEKTNGS